jgi:hypothetical protein
VHSLLIKSALRATGKQVLFSTWREEFKMLCDHWSEPRRNSSGGFVMAPLAIYLNIFKKIFVICVNHETLASKYRLVISTYKICAVFINK